MLRFWKAVWCSGGFAPLMDAPETVGASGSPDPVDGGDGLPPSEVDIDPAAGDEPTRAATTDDDDEDDDDPDLREDAEVSPERVKRMAAKLKKLNRRDRSFRVERARLRELRDQGVTLDDLIHGNRQHRALAEQIANNPALKRLVTGDTAEDEAARREPPARVEPEDPEFDESSLPFDPNENDANRYFANMAKQNHELQRAAKKLTARLDQIEGKDVARAAEETKRAELAEKSTWKGAIDAAAKTIEDETVRTLFKDAVAAAYQNRQRHGKSVNEIIAHYLKGKLAPGQAKAANDAAAKVTKTAAPAPQRTAATQQRIAEQNKTLPRTVAPAGSPASARTGKESLVDVRRRLTGRARP